MTSNRTSFRILSWLILIISTLTMESARAQDPVVEMLLFYSESCSHCEQVLEEVIPPLREKYADRIELAMLDIGDPANRWLQLELEKQIGVPGYGRGLVPMMFVGPSLDGSVQGALLVGSKSIGEELDSIIQKDLNAGGAPLPFFLEDVLKELRQLLTATPEPPPESEPPRSLAASTPVKEPLATLTPTKKPEPIHIAYFAEPGCPECARAKYDLNLLVHRYPEVKVTTFDISQDTELEKWLEEQTGVPQEKRGITPAIFVGRSFLSGDQVNYANLRALVGRYQATGALPLWDKWAAERSRAQAKTLQLFHSFDLFTVLLTGLKDGLSPCALVTLIFLISCLALTGHQGRKAIAAGGAFSLGVCVTRLIAGLGLLKVLAVTDALMLARRGVYSLTAVLCFAQVGLALYDRIQARSGWLQSIYLRTRWPIDCVIAESARTWAFALGALVAGFGLSLPGVVCTGQTYLATTTFVMGIPELQVPAIRYLLLYSLAFILPLIAVLTLALVCTSSRGLGLWATGHRGATRWLTAGLFLLAGLYLLLEPGWL